MGVGLYVDGKRYAGWAYSGFGTFREKVASEIGIELRKMEGFHDVDREVLSSQGWEAYHEAIKADSSKDKISWATVNDPLAVLLRHSDCDGTIAPEECGPLADRLEEVIRDWPEKFSAKIDPFWHDKGYPPELELDNYDKAQAKGLIEGLREAARLNKPLEFC